ncbi:FHA domain-containing protein [Luteimonas sp. e5]
MNHAVPTSLILRFAEHEHPDLPLRPGVNGLCQDPDFDRGLMIAEPGADALLTLVVDVRGLWLNVSPGVRGVHVNGRPVQQLARLWVGDLIHCEGVEMQLASAQARASEDAAPGRVTSSRLLLRGHGGAAHGQAWALHEACRIDRHGGVIPAGQDASVLAELQPAGEDRVWLQLLAEARGARLNGWPLASGWVHGGDQLLLAGQRFVVESPGQTPPPAKPPRMDQDDDVAAVAPRPRRMHLPWLLLAAIVSALLLAALLWFGVK